MKIAIIGAGNIGGGLGRAWVATGHDVSFGVRNADDPKALVAVASIRERVLVAAIDVAVQNADVVALAVPFAAASSAMEAAGGAAGKILIDCTNPIGAKLPADVASGAEAIARLAPRARLVKAFNSQGAENLLSPRYGDVAATSFYCGDDAEAKLAVRALVVDVGFDPVDVGPLKNARLLESATLLWFAASQALGTRRVGFRMLRDA